MEPQMGAVKGTTITLTLTDVSATLQSLCDTALGGSFDFSTVAGCLITCEAFDARIAFGRTATTAIGHIIAAGASLRLTSKSHFAAAHVISKTAGSAAILQVTLEGV